MDTSNPDVVVEVQKKFHIQPREIIRQAYEYFNYRGNLAIKIDDYFRLRITSPEVAEYCHLILQGKIKLNDV